MLDAGAAQHRVRVIGDVSGGPDGRIVGAQLLINDDPIINGKARFLGQFGDRGCPQTRNNIVSLEDSAVIEGDLGHFMFAHRTDALPSDEVHPSIGEKLLVLRRNLGRELRTTQRRIGGDEGDLAALLDEARSKLGTDISAADDHELVTGLGQRTQLLVVPSRPKVEDGIAVIVNARRGEAGNEQQLLVAEYLAGSGQDGLAVTVNAEHLSAEPQFRAGVSDSSKVDLVPGELRVGPQLLAQRWPRIRGVDVSAEDGDRPFLVDVADTAGGRISGHPATDNEVLVRRHICSQDGVHRRNDAYTDHGNLPTLPLRGFQRAFRTRPSFVWHIGTQRHVLPRGVAAVATRNRITTPRVNPLTRHEARPRRDGPRNGLGARSGVTLLGNGVDILHLRLGPWGDHEEHHRYKDRHDT